MAGTLRATRGEGVRMFEVSIDETFAAGHALRGYRGKCENLHGHNYKVRVTLTGDTLDQIGLLYDFKDLKAVTSEVIERLDHQYLNDLEPFRQNNPSAENMARYIYDEIKALLFKSTDGRVRIKHVKIWETDTSTATYFE
jgi:6-pyruvoyltetrahydropterin/6-carboxytetrahydropterin synthase